MTVTIPLWVLVLMGIAVGLYILLQIFYIYIGRRLRKDPEYERMMDDAAHNLVDELGKHGTYPAWNTENCQRNMQTNRMPVSEFLLMKAGITDEQMQYLSEDIGKYEKRHRKELPLPEIEDIRKAIAGGHLVYFEVFALASLFLGDEYTEIRKELVETAEDMEAEHLREVRKAHMGIGRKTERNT